MMLLKKLKPVILNLAGKIDFKNKRGFTINEICPRILAKYAKNNFHFLHTSSFYSWKFKIYKYLCKYNKYSLCKSKYAEYQEIIKSKCKYTIIRLGDFWQNGPNHLTLNNFINNSLNKENQFFMEIKMINEIIYM